MRTILRALTLIAAMIPVVVALAVAPASAATQQAVPNTLPTATLTGASVSFTTNDEDKDGDSIVQVYLLTNTNVTAAIITGTFGHFDDGSFHGPYAMNTTAGITASNLSTGLVHFNFAAIFSDTWRFNYSITLTFSDGSSFVIRENNKSLTEKLNSFQTPFALTSQAPVPDVVGRTQSAATAALQAAGLTLGTVTQRTDSSCNHINTVWTESPGAGTVVNTGTAVNLTIGVKPKTPCP
jgi:hypothetical protein